MFLQEIFLNNLEDIYFLILKKNHYYHLLCYINDTSVEFKPLLKLRTRVHEKVGLQQIVAIFLGIFKAIYSTQDQDMLRTIVLKLRFHQKRLMMLIFYLKWVYK